MKIYSAYWEKEEVDKKISMMMRTISKVILESRGVVKMDAAHLSKSLLVLQFSNE